MRRKYEPNWIDTTDFEVAAKGYRVEEDMAPFAHEKPDNHRYRHCRVMLGGEVHGDWQPGLPPVG